ncbi:MAG: MarR family transcriptional regulator [Burkholderiaceae bacterium]|nr:MarR family transcriptional regulator [Burkholderiaceae bacterium]
MQSMSELDKIQMHVTMSLTQVARAYTYAADKLASNFGLSQATAWPAVMIGRIGDGARPGVVADFLGLEPSSLVRVMDQLTESGLVERREDPNDRRAKILRLTSEGKKRVAQIEQALIPFRRGLLKGVSIADLEACQRVLNALHESIRRKEDNRSA